MIRRSSPMRRPVPTVESLVLKLRQRMESQNFQPGELVGTELELARSEGASRMLVRRAVETLVREGQLQRRPGKGLYVPDRRRFARNGDGATRLVQIVMPDLLVNRCVEIAHAAKEVGLNAGVRTQLYDAHKNLDSDLEVVRHLPESSAQGALIASVHHRRFTEALFTLKTAGYPFVVVDESPRGLNVPSVVADNYRGGYLVGKKLIAQGHRRIGFVGFLGADTARDRVEGLRDAMADAGLPLPGSLISRLHVQSMGDWSAAVERAVGQLLDQPDRATAIFFNHDLAAAQGYAIIRTMGLRIPEDVSVVGFDGEPLCGLLTPTLATIRQPAAAMGAAAMEMLLALMDGDAMAGESRMEAGVVKRAASTAAAARGGSEAGGHEDPQTRRHREGSEMKAEGGNNGREVSIAGQSVAPMETDAPKFSRPRRPTANITRDQDGAWRHVLSVTWQDGDSLGPAPDTRAERHGDADIGGRGDAVQAPQLVGV